MKQKIYYIVLYKDLAMMPLPRLPEKSDIQDGARFFEVAGNVEVQEISEWMARGYNHNRFREIRGEA